MKSTWASVLTVAVIAFAAICIADDSSAAQFPSIDEITSTINAPDYSVDRFFSDVKYMFSADMLKSMVDYGSNLITFLKEDTFLGHIGSGDVKESFTSNYLNIVVLLCFIIAAICILGAFISYFVNRKTFFRLRED